MRLPKDMRPASTQPLNNAFSNKPQLAATCRNTHLCYKKNMRSAMYFIILGVYVKLGTDSIIVQDYSKMPLGFDSTADCLKRQALRYSSRSSRKR